MPAQAGIQTHLNFLGSRLRGNDENGHWFSAHFVLNYQIGVISLAMNS